VQRGDGTLVTVEPASGTLQDVASAINAASDAGIRATVVRGGTAQDGTPLYRLQLTATSTGEKAGAFQVYAGTKADVEAKTAARLDTQPVRTAQDAQITLSTGDTLTQASNTFESLIAGVDVTVSGESVGESVTVSVARDDAALSKLASDLVSSLGVVLSEISSRTASKTTTDDDGRTVVTGGLFSGDSAVRDLQQQVSRAASYPVDGVSPAEVGIVVGKDGSFTFDSAKFAEALAADPAKVQKIVSGVAQRVADVADAASDSHEGTLTLKVQAQEGEVKDLGEQIADWDVRLASRREGLQRTYTQLEVTLSNLQSQSTWLSGQLASLSSGSAG
jgi:flagellar hook-associated protein 2